MGTARESNPAVRKLALLLLGLAAVAVGLLLIFNGRTSKPLVEVERTALVSKEGKLCLKDSNVPFSGVMLEHYPGGEIRSRSFIAAGILDGVSWGYFTNGQMQVEEHFKAGVSDGVRRKWYPDGTKLSEAAIANGKLAGTFRRWHENGSLAEEVQMKDGQPEGVSTSYHPDGSLKARATLQNGKVIEQKFWKVGEFTDTSAGGKRHET